MERSGVGSEVEGRRGVAADLAGELPSNRGVEGIRLGPDKVATAPASLRGNQDVSEVGRGAGVT